MSASVISKPNQTSTSKRKPPRQSNPDLEPKAPTNRTETLGVSSAPHHAASKAHLFLVVSETFGHGNGREAHAFERAEHANDGIDWVAASSQARCASLKKESTPKATKTQSPNLSGVSGAATKRFKQAIARTCALSDVLSDCAMGSLAKKLRDCARSFAPQLGQWKNAVTGQTAFRCRHRFCPLCQTQGLRELGGALRERLMGLNLSNLEVQHWTLTTVTCAGGLAKQEIARCLKAFVKIRAQAWFKRCVIGTNYAVDPAFKPDGSAHVHLHVAILARLGGGDVQRPQLRQKLGNGWQRLLQSDVALHVDIKVHESTGATDLINNLVRLAFYANKPWIDDARDVNAVQLRGYLALKGIQLRGTTGQLQATRRRVAVQT